MDTKLTRRSFLGVAGGAALALAACGGNSGEAEAPAEGEAAEGEAAGASVGGGTLTVGSAYGPSSFDPATSSSAFGLSAIWNVVEGLYDIDFHDYSTADGLCVGDPVWVDDNHAEITLREGAKFSDGNPVTPEDVIESFTRASAGTYAPFLSMFESIEKKDDATLTVSVTIPKFSLIKERLGIIRVSPAAQSQEDATAQPIGSGPWMFTEVSDTYVTMAPNPNYNGTHPAQDSELRMDSLTDPTARVTAAQEGSNLICESVPPESIDQLAAAGMRIDQVQGFATRFIMFNVKKAPWNDVRVRQAIMYCLNTDQMIQNAFSGLAAKPKCYLPESFTNFHEASVVYDYDLAKAQQLIADSGITPGNIELRTTDNAQVMAMGTQAQQDIQALGFTVNLQSDISKATYGIIDQADESWDILMAPGDPSCFGGDTDLLLNWWYGDNIWMQTRCAWNTSEEWKQVNSLMADALTKSGAEQQECWNQVFDIIAENVVLYPVLQVITPTASWDVATGASPTGVSVQNFSGIGTTGVVLTDVATVTA